VLFHNSNAFLWFLLYLLFPIHRLLHAIFSKGSAVKQNSFNKAWTYFSHQIKPVNYLHPGIWIFNASCKASLACSLWSWNILLPSSKLLPNAERAITSLARFWRKGHASISHDPSEDNIPSHLLTRSLQLSRNNGNIVCGAIRISLGVSISIYYIKLYCVWWKYVACQICGVFLERVNISLLMKKTNTCTYKTQFPISFLKCFKTDQKSISTYEMQATDL